MIFIQLQLRSAFSPGNYYSKAIHINYQTCSQTRSTTSVRLDRNLVPHQRSLVARFSDTGSPPGCPRGHHT
jgi:hypothetical protein